MEYKIISDSSCDLSEEEVLTNGVEVVPFYVSFNGVDYLKERTEMPVREFYNRMVENPGVYPKSSLPSVADYTDIFTEYVKKGMGVICICITTKFSGSYNAASTAKDIVLDEYPEAKISVIDSTVDTVLQGLFVLEAARMQRQGVSFEENVAELERIKGTGRIFFTIGNIDYLRAGGRIGKLAGVAAGMLSLKPLITLKNGEIYPSGITRSRKKGMSKLLDMVVEYIKENTISVKDFSISVGFGYDPEEAVEFEKMLEEKLVAEFGFCPTIIVSQIGAAIAVHTGPYSIGVGIIRRAGVSELETVSSGMKTVTV